MRQLFEEYGGPILAALAITLLIVIIKASGVTASDQFNKLTDTFYKQVTQAQENVPSGGTTGGTTP